MNNSLTFRRVAVMCGVTLVVSSCGMFSSNQDRVLQGSLTLTPLRVPKNLDAPDSRNALHIPDQTSYSPKIKQSELEKPPLLDTALADELEKKLSSNVTKTSVQTFQVAMLQTPGNYAELAVQGDFDVLWQYMDGALEKLGFQVTDRDRSQHRYYVTRKLPMSREEQKQLENTGEERTSGGDESYQIEVYPADKTVNIKILNTLGQVENSRLGRHLLLQIQAYLEQPLIN
jgi:uncharacterized lipoprotein